MASSPEFWLPEPARSMLGGSLPLETYVSTPDGDAPGRGWPALVFLHGNGECAGRRTMAEAFLDADTSHGPLRRVSPDLEQRVRGTFVVAAPQLPGSGGDVWPDHADGVGALVEHLVDERSVDPDGLTLCGFSYGANGAVRLSHLHPWRALWVVDPPMAPPPSLPDFGHYRMAFGQFTRPHEAGWRAVLPADRRRVVDYGDEHGQASWSEFAEWEHYTALL